MEIPKEVVETMRAIQYASADELWADEAKLRDDLGNVWASLFWLKNDEFHEV